MKTYKLKRFLLDIVYPNKCPFCNEGIASNQYYCPACPGSLAMLEEDCEPLESITETVAVFEYSDSTSKFVYSIKDGGNGYAISAATKLLYEKMGGKSGNLSQSIDLIICVPTDSGRMRERGYNPPALIAKEIARMTGIPCKPKLLIKTRQTEVQKSLSAVERKENLKGVFALRKGKTCPQNVLLVDDVRTTGATLSEAAKVLQSAGAENVYAAVVAVVSKA